jgi:hypothetical protein
VGPRLILFGHFLSPGKTHKSSGAMFFEFVAVIHPTDDELCFGSWKYQVRNVQASKFVNINARYTSIVLVVLSMGYVKLFDIFKSLGFRTWIDCLPFRLLNNSLKSTMSLQRMVLSNVVHVLLS